MGRWLILGLTVVLAAACSEQPEPTSSEGKQAVDNTLMRTITGEVWYRERMALPNGAEVKVVLEDQSRMDVAATKLADYTHIVNGPGPYTYRLVYDPASIDDRMRYGLRARIENEGKLLFTSTEHIDPFSYEPGEEIKIMVSMVGGNPGAPTVSPTKPPASLTDTNWELTELDGAPAIPGANGNVLNMMLASDGSQASGFAGCNQFTGGFTVDGDQITLGPLASTRKMCAEAMDQETSFLQALGKVKRFAINQEALSLFDAEGQQVLLFNAGN